MLFVVIFVVVAVVVAVVVVVSGEDEEWGEEDVEGMSSEEKLQLAAEQKPLKRRKRCNKVSGSVWVGATEGQTIALNNWSHKNDGIDRPESKGKITGKGL